MKFPYIHRRHHDATVTLCNAQLELLAAQKELITSLKARVADLETGTSRKATEQSSVKKFRWANARSSFEANSLREANTPKDTAEEIEQRGDANVSHN